MVIVFSGCRNATQEARPLVKEWLSHVTDCEVRVGCAQGIDAIVRAECPGVTVYEAEWGKYGKNAGPLRNRKMLEGAHRLVAFWDGRSRGTLDCISQAVELGTDVRIVPIPNMVSK